jgi:hypothetical protein
MNNKCKCRHSRGTMNIFKNYTVNSLQYIIKFILEMKLQYSLDCGLIGPDIMKLRK